MVQVLPQTFGNEVADLGMQAAVPMASGGILGSSVRYGVTAAGPGSLGTKLGFVIELVIVSSNSQLCV